MRCLPLCLIGLLAAAPLAAQRAQLGRKGRVREGGPAVVRTPIRKLPRRMAPPTEIAIGPSALDRYMDRLRAEQPPPRGWAEDRLRPLVRAAGPVAPVGPRALGDPVDPLPRRPEGDPLAGLPREY
ncbi:MAG TPA: hypothetical protein DEH78_23465, partial [Solibacterales bacterium]|nr:hypothetical protein [Bryobacterales bacterium]